ncbi:MAG: glycosyltransferase family 9 protein [Bdellovibrionota bacterium]
MRILLSRTDNIGDVIFTLPMAGVIKKYYPQSKVYFLGKDYTRAIVECCSYIDGFYNFDEMKKEKFDVIIHVFPNKEVAFFAQKNKIPVRIGTNRRFFHWLTCNKLVNLTRKNSTLHEAQLNLKLLRPLQIHSHMPIEHIVNYYGFTQIAECAPRFLSLIDKNKFNLILHPKSKGSAREWSAQHYVELCSVLPKEKFNIFVSGTKEEEKEIQEKIISQCPHVTSVVGLFSLSEFISFIANCDGLIACSTGPLHIAAALGKRTLGLYPPIRNMMPARWGALGAQAENLTGFLSTDLKNRLCTVEQCNRNTLCKCINGITPHSIANKVMGWV